MALEKNLGRAVFVRLEEPFNPDQAQVEINIKLAEAFYPAEVWRCLLEIEQAVEIPFDDNIAEINGNRADKTQFLFAPHQAGDVPDTGIQHIAAADFETCSAGTAVDRVEIDRYGMAVFAKRTDYDVKASRPFSLRL